MNKKVDKNKQNISKVFIYIVVIALIVTIIIYSASGVLELIKNPTEVYMISNGSISLEEAISRSYN